MLFYLFFNEKCYFTCFPLRNTIYLFLTNKSYFTCFSQRNVILLVFHQEMLFYLFFTKKCYFIVACFLEKMRYCTRTLYLCTLVAVHTPMNKRLLRWQESSWMTRVFSDCKRSLRLQVLSQMTRVFSDDWEGSFNLPDMFAIKESMSKLDNFIGTLVGNLKSMEP